MKTIVTSLVLIFILAGCDEGTNPELRSQKFFVNAKVIETYPFVSAGDSIAFERYYRAEDEENIADDEYQEYFLFQVPEVASSFEYSDSELESLNIKFKPVCYCGLPSGNVIEGGTIKGIKKGNGWEIDANVDLKLTYQYNQDSTFIADEITNITFKDLFRESTLSDIN